jgi:hypothetical protein
VNKDKEVAMGGGGGVAGWQWLWVLLKWRNVGHRTLIDNNDTAI